MTSTTTTTTIDLEVTPHTLMMIFGGSGRVSDIIGKVGYTKLLDAMDAGDADKLRTLHSFVGWALGYLEEQP